MQIHFKLCFAQNKKNKDNKILLKIDLNRKKTLKIGCKLYMKQRLIFFTNFGCWDQGCQQKLTNNLKNLADKNLTIMNGEGEKRCESYQKVVKI